MIGIPLGILIGIVTGVSFLFLVHTAWRSSEDPKAIFSVVAHILAIPTFWFGGPWLTTTMLADVQPGSILTSYLVSLTCTFVAISIFILVKLVKRLGEGM